MKPIYTFLNICSPIIIAKIESNLGHLSFHTVYKKSFINGFKERFRKIKWDALEQRENWGALSF